MEQQKSTVIREPKWADIPALLVLGKRLHAESWYSHIEYSEDRVAVFFGDQILKRDGYFCRLATLEENIIGAIAGSKTKHWFSNEYGAFDNFLYVIPEKRGSTLAYRLWKEFRDWSKSVGVVELTHGVGTAIASPKADKFFRGAGMTHVGGIYKLNLRSDK